MNGIVKLLQIVLIAAAAVQVAAAQPTIFTALNGTSSGAVLSPGSWVSIYGANFAPSPQTASNAANLPLTLGGASVTVGGISASLGYVSPAQINALIPLSVASRRIRLCPSR